MQKTSRLVSFLLLFTVIGMGVAATLAEPAATNLNIPAPQMTEDPNPPPPTSAPSNTGTGTTGTTNTVSPVVTSTNLGPTLANLGANGIVYTDHGNIIIYGVDANSTGYVALVVTAEEIASVSSTPSKNTLITRDGIYAVYRLTTGELQVNVGPVANGEVFEVVFENNSANKARVTSFGTK